MSYSPINPLQRQMPRAWAAALQSHPFDVVGTLDYKGGTNRQTALEAAMVFWSRVDRVVFGSAQVQRHGARLQRVCFFEHGHNRRPTDREVKLASSHAAETRIPNWHYHFYVRGGGRYPSPDELVALIKSQWARIEEAGKHGIVEPYDPEKGSWSGYLCWKSQGWCELTSTWFSPPPIPKPSRAGRGL
jgi:hypothetical protein